jgi:hypothetical protein
VVDLKRSESKYQIVPTALEGFSEAMALRAERNVRVAKRATVMLRADIVNIVLIDALMAVMTWAYIDRLGVMI